MSFSLTIGPNWVSLLKKLPSSTDILRIYGTPALLNNMGVFEVNIEGIEGFTWDFAGLYEVKVNGGGLISETPLEPTRDLVPPIEVLDVSGIISRIARFTEPSGSPGFFNVVGWKPLTPVIVRDDMGLKGCIKMGIGSATLINLEPLHPGSVVTCVEPPRGYGDFNIDLGVFRINFKGYIARYGDLKVIENSNVSAVISPTAITMRSDTLEEVIVKHPYRDYAVSLMHILSFYKFKGRGLFRGVSAVIEGSRGSLGLASPQGFEIEASEGFVKLRFIGELTLIQGGYVEASRALIEKSIKWAIVETPRNPVGHIRSYRSTPVLTSFDEGYAKLTIVNPTMADGVVEAKMYYPVVEARFTTLNEWIEVKPVRDTITIPTPRGYYGLLEVKLNKIPLTYRTVGV